VTESYERVTTHGVRRCAAAELALYVRVEEVVEDAEQSVRGRDTAAMSASSQAGPQRPKDELLPA
jgi:NifU-like protein involved in Fe-S cluster formation